MNIPNRPVFMCSEAAVMMDYASTPIFRIIPDAHDRLHAFFSPKRVPIGLTDKEVALCVRLYPYRKRLLETISTQLDAKIPLRTTPLFPRPACQDALHLVETGIHATIGEAEEHLECLWYMAEYLHRHPIRSIALPVELNAETVMTRERFRAGIRAFIAEYRNVCEI